MLIKKNTFIILLIIFCNSTGSQAQGNSLTAYPPKYNTVNGTFSGKITDARTGKGIEAATVYIADIKLGTSSDAEGNFRISNIPQGMHLVEISHIGYSSIAENIEIQNDVRKNFVLTESIIESNEVVVTGVTGATRLKKIPFAVSVMRKEDFFRNTSSNIIESLTKIGGVSVLATGPAISKPVIRGLSYNRVLTINDGVRQEGQQWGRLARSLGRCRRYRAS
jgi:iron complex outermembrane receptor protein